MVRLGLVTIVVLVIASAALFREFELASVVGVVIGAGFFVLAVGKGNGFVNASLKRDPERPNDPNAGISMGLGAAGIAAMAVANPHYPVAFHAFYLVCLTGGLAIAQTIAIRYKGPAVAITPNSAKESPESGAE